MTGIIAIANQKGGVAKTTTCLNLGHALSEQGLRVLLVDLDPQASLTISLGFDVRDLLSTIYDVLLDTKDGLTIKDIVQKTSMKGLDLAPASIDLSKAEMDLFSEMNRERALKDALKPVQGTYDYVLIDCPPSLGLLTTNALAAADFVLIPLQSDYLAMRGAELLLSTIEKVQRKLNPKLQLLGVLVTMYSQTSHSRDVLREVQAAFKDRTFTSIIPSSVRAKESVVSGKSILDYDSKSKLARSYRELADEVIAYAKEAKRLAMCAPAITRGPTCFAGLSSSTFWLAPIAAAACASWPRSRSGR
jgi:chromosome partitioning protein